MVHCASLAWKSPTRPEHRQQNVAYSACILRCARYRTWASHKARVLSILHRRQGYAD